MNKEYSKLYDDLKLFQQDHEDFDELLDFTESRILNFSRVVKKEVIDMSDLMEKMALIMLNQGEQIKAQNHQLKKIREKLGDTVEEEKQPEEQQIAEDHDEIPALFSLRRSPYYQTKIIQR